MKWKVVKMIEKVQTRGIWEWYRRYRDKRLHSVFGDTMLKQKFKWKIVIQTLRFDLFDAVSLSQIQSNMILTVFYFDVQIA